MNVLPLLPKVIIHETDNKNAQICSLLEFFDDDIASVPRSNKEDPLALSPFFGLQSVTFAILETDSA